MYTLVVLPEADDAIARIAAWWGEHRSIEQSDRWIEGIYDAIESLRQNPLRCPIALENDPTLFPAEIRELHSGLSSHPTHRVLFTVRPEEVIVLTVRHAAQDGVQPDDINFPV
jgi:plasmid stabilization system protein ParE